MKHLAQSISIIFHPLLIAIYVLLAIMMINPYLFGVYDARSKGVLIISVFLLSFFFPVISILMMKGLGLIKSIHMKERTERIGPMIATGIFYLWLYINIRSNTVIPGAYSFFMLGATIALFVSFLITTFQKISLHGVGVGGLLIAMIVIGSQFSYGSFFLQISSNIYSIDISVVYILTILIAGVTLTSRLILNAHVKEELYGGLFVGAASQILAYFIFF